MTLEHAVREDFEKWINKANSRDFWKDFLSANAISKKHRPTLEQAHSIVEHYAEHKNIMWAGLWLSTVYNKLQGQKTILFNADTPPLTNLGYRLMKKTLIVTKPAGRVGDDSRDARFILYTPVIAAGDKGHSLILNYSHLGEAMRNASGLLINMGHIEKCNFIQHSSAINFGTMDSYNSSFFIPINWRRETLLINRGTIKDMGDYEGHQPKLTPEQQEKITTLKTLLEQGENNRMKALQALEMITPKKLDYYTFFDTEIKKEFKK